MGDGPHLAWEMQTQVNVITFASSNGSPTFLFCRPPSSALANEKSLSDCKDENQPCRNSACSQSNKRLELMTFSWKAMGSMKMLCCHYYDPISSEMEIWMVVFKDVEVAVIIWQWFLIQKLWFHLFLSSYYLIFYSVRWASRSSGQSLSWQASLSLFANLNVINLNPIQK